MLYQVVALVLLIGKVNMLIQFSFLSFWILIVSLLGIGILLGIFFISIGMLLNLSIKDNNLLNNSTISARKC